jgi:ABC-type protease/lipase transport system fused ATPase/permease subunit
MHFISLYRRKNSMLMMFGQGCLQSRNNSARSKEAEADEVVLFSTKRIIIVAKLIAVLISVVILLLPVFMLSIVPMKRKIATTLVLIFVLIFGLLMSLFAGAKARTVFVSSCA